MEQTLGHRSHTGTLKKGVEADPDISADWFLAEFETKGIPWSWPLVRHNWSLRGSLRAWQGLRQFAAKPVDALFIHTFTITLFAKKFVERIPTVLSTDATPENYDQVGSWYGHRVQPKPIESAKKRLRARVLQKAAAVVTWCDWAKASLVEDYGLDADNVHVIAPGTEIANFKFGAERRVNGREGPVRLLFVGGDFDRKGGNVLLQAYRSAFRGRAELHLVTQEEVAEERGVFVHRGLSANSPELLSLYQNADIFVLPTLGDCFPVVLGEAMAAGLPIVTTDVGALREAVENERNGLIVPAGDDVALVSALNVLADSPEVRVGMGRAGRRIAEQRFDSARNAQRVLAVLKGVCERRPTIVEPEPQAVPR